MEVKGGCTKENVPEQENADDIFVQEGSFVLYQCNNGYHFDSLNDGIIWCDTAVWESTPIQCIKDGKTSLCL